MNRSVQLYIEGQRIELFQDEAIQVTSSIQNVQDISKTYTDFSQGFTVPASSHNNAIFEHWYQSDVNATNDPNIRRDAYIEIDLTTFRKGKIQLDGAVITNGKPSAYNITFFGEGVTLKDLFGEDLLSDLDYTSLSHEYTSAAVKTRIEDNTNAYDVKYPLITSNRIWQYQSTPIDIPLPNWLTATITQNDIHTTSGAINKDELFPALRVSKIFDLIQNKYGITFQGTFLQDQRFTDLFLWYKNKEFFKFFTAVINLDFTAKSSVPVTPTPNYAEVAAYLTNAVDLTNNTIRVQNTINDIFTHFITFNVTTLTTGATAYVNVYQNGNFYQTVNITTTGIQQPIQIQNTIGLDDLMTFDIRANNSANVTMSIEYQVSGVVEDSLGVPVNFSNKITISVASLTLISNIDLSTLAPVMKIADFLKGIMLMFNMTIYSITEGEYWLEPLDDWYSKGAVIDITSFTDVTSIEHNRMPLYKKIQFKFQDSECVLNKYFITTFNRSYGDTTYQYNYDGGEFTIEVPFENLLQTKFNGTQDLQLGYSLNGEFSPYIPKPVLLYQYDNQVTDFKFVDDGGGHSTITTYTPFGQDLLYNGNDVTLNFAPETSTLLNTAIQTTGFSQYYFSYLYNLYNLKQRLVNVKTNLPTSLVTGLQLNDRLVIRDKRYIINEMKTNLSTGDVDLQLILDFRPVINSTQTPPVVPTGGGLVQIGVQMPNGSLDATLECDLPDVIIDPAFIESSQNVEITIPSNVSGTVYTITANFNYINGDTSTAQYTILQL